MPDFPLAYPSSRLWPPRATPEFAALLVAEAMARETHDPEADNQIWDWEAAVLSVSCATSLATARGATAEDVDEGPAEEYYASPSLDMGSEDEL